MNLFRSRRGLISIAAIAAVPLLYSAAYLGAFWNPYGHLNQIPIAIVNKDHGSASQSLVHELDREFVTHEETPSEAGTALANGRVGLVMIIGSHFSADLNRGQTAHLSFMRSPGTNYLTSILMQREAEGIASAYAQSVRVKTLSLAGQGVRQLTGSATQLAHGTAILQANLWSLAGSQGTRLVSGASTMSHDLGTLQEGLTSWSEGDAKMVSALDGVANGSAAANRGAGTLVHGAGQLVQDQRDMAETTGQILQAQQGISARQQGLQQETSDLADSSRGTSQAATENETLSRQLQQLLTAYSAAPSAKLFTQIESVAQQQNAVAGSMAGVSGTLTSGLSTLSQQMTSVSGGLNQVSSGLKTLDVREDTLTQGTSSWVSDTDAWSHQVNVLAEDDTHVAEASRQLNDGAEALTGQEGQMSPAMKHLATSLSLYDEGLTTIAQHLGTVRGNTQELASHVKRLERPLHFATHPLSVTTRTSGSSNYGTGMAPYFLGLSLWVGAVVATVLVPGGRRRRQALDSRNAHSLTIGLLQVALLGIGTVIILPLRPVHPWAYAGILLGIGVVWWAIIRLLVEKLGDAGRIIGIILLVVQLAGSSGTYPVLLSPRFFQMIHPYLPMTWAIHLLRWSLSNGYPARVGTDIGYLAALGLISVALVRLWPKQWFFHAPVLTDDDDASMETSSPVAHSVQSGV